MEKFKRRVSVGVVSLLMGSALFGSSLFAGEVYRWVDAEGAVHFSDSAGIAVDSKEARRIEIRTPNLADAKHALSADQGSRDGDISSDKRIGVMPSLTPSVRIYKNPAAKCESIEQALERLRSTMRAGYKASEQQRLHERELALMKARAEHCR